MFFLKIHFDIIMNNYSKITNPENSIDNQGFEI